MKEEIVFQPSEDLAYWIGLVQSDGSLTKWTKKTGKIQYYLHFGNSSLILIKEFQKGLKHLNRFSRYIRKRNDNFFESKISANSLLAILDSIKISRSRKKFEPPNWITTSQNLFGAYLAGLIDGDGNVRIKRKKYPQCAIRITSGEKEFILHELIKKFLKCSAFITEKHRKVFYRKENRFIDGKSFDLEFLASRKNSNFLSEYVLPHIKLDYKREKIINYITNRYAAAGI